MFYLSSLVRKSSCHRKSKLLITFVSIFDQRVTSSALHNGGIITRGGSGIIWQASLAINGVLLLSMDKIGDL